MKVGWIYSRIRERIQVARCFKCLGYGHHANHCGGPDRSGLCYRCGKVGHKAVSCKDEMQCVLCAELDEKTGVSVSQVRVGCLHILLPGARESIKGEKKNQTKMINVLQGNLHRSKTANDLLAQLAMEKKAVILILSEQYKDVDSPTWYSDILGTAAIRVLNPVKLPVENHGAGKSFVWIRSKDTTYVSCNLTPSESISDFQEKLDLLEDTICEKIGRILVAGDCNARAVEWGVPKPDSRGKRILEMVARTGLIVMNRGCKPNFRRPGQRGPIPDITLASERLAPLMSHWKMMEDYTASDHQYISYSLGEIPNKRERHNAQPRWNTTKLNEELFDRVITNGKEALCALYDGIEQPDRLKTLIKATTQLIQKACDKSMPWRKTQSNRRSVY